MVCAPVVRAKAASWHLATLAALLSIVPGEGFRHRGLRLAGSQSSSGNEVASKPSLRLAFEAEVLMVRQFAGDVSRLTSESRHVAVDDGRLAVAIQLPVAPGHRGPHGGMMFDIGNGIRIDSEPFFDELVCFAFDLTGSGRTAPSLDEGRALFAKAAGDVLGVPIGLYEPADQIDRQLEIAGRNCRVWAADRSAEFTFPPIAELQALFAGLGTSQGLANKFLHSAGKGGRLALKSSARFCVDAAGQLLAANATRSAALVGPNGTEGQLLRSEATRTVLSKVRGIDKNMTQFSPERRAAGGRCVDLTTAAAEKGSELKRGLNDGERLARINREARGTWKATPYHHWRDTSVSDIVGTMGTGIRPLRLPLLRMCPDGNARPSCHLPVGIADTAAATAPPPQRFDARKRWRHCPSIRTVRNQGKCGSCWAVAAAGVMSDRLCIAASHANGTDHRLGNLTLSPQYMLDCSSDNSGCAGGHLDDAWEFLLKRGIPEETCDPYAFCPRPSDPQCGLDERDAQAAAEGAMLRPRQCPESCAGADQAPRPLFHARSVYAVSSPGDVLGIQQEILTNGPVEAAFFVFSDFHNYRRGTYFRTPSAFGPLGGHAVRITGWGVDGHDTDYWLAANSFGRKWGMRGFFRIRRGTNECGIETMPAAGLPLLSAQAA